MTKTTPKTVVKAHRGMAHVPRRGRRRPPIQRRPVGDPPRRRPPIQQPTGRRMTPAQRDAMRRQRQLALRRQRQLSRMSPRERMQFMMERDLRNRGLSRSRQITPAQRDRMRRQLENAAKRQLDRPVLPIRRRPTVEQLKNAQQPLNIFKRRKRRPTGDPKPRKRPTTPKQKQRVVQATQAPRTVRKPRRPV